MLLLGPLISLASALPFVVEELGGQVGEELCRNLRETKELLQLLKYLSTVSCRTGRHQPVLAELARIEQVDAGKLLSRQESFRKIGDGDQVRHRAAPTLVEKEISSYSTLDLPGWQKTQNYFAQRKRVTILAMNKRCLSDPLERRLETSPTEPDPEVTTGRTGSDPVLLCSWLMGIESRFTCELLEHHRDNT